MCANTGQLREVLESGLERLGCTYVISDVFRDTYGALMEQGLVRLLIGIVMTDGIDVCHAVLHGGGIVVLEQLL